MKKSLIQSGFLMLFLAFKGFGAMAQNTEELKAKIDIINKEMQQAMISGKKFL